MIVIKGGLVMTAAGWHRLDVLIGNGRVVKLGPDLTAESAVDAGGYLVGPGFVDMHTHLREPGQTWKEDIASGSAAAAAGGFTAVVAMPNTQPPIDSVRLVEEVQARGREVGLVDVFPSAALTVGRLGRVASNLEDLHAHGVRVFTDDGDCLADGVLLAEIMMRLSRLGGAVVAQHAEDPTRTAGGHMHAGEMSQRLGIGGQPAEAETDVVRRDLELVEATGARYHVQHASSASTVELVRESKAKGLPVTAEVTPHHLTFDESSLESQDTRFKMYPPLRSELDRKSLVEALTDGTIDVVATDHAPHSADEKGVEFTAAPRGVIGLETAASAVWEAVGDGDRLFSRLSTSPARIAGLRDHGRPIAPGAPANIVVFDPGSTWVADVFRSKSANSPFLGRPMRGRVVATMLRGEVVNLGGEIRQ